MIFFLLFLRLLNMSKNKKLKIISNIKLNTNYKENINNLQVFNRNDDNVNTNNKLSIEVDLNSATDTEALQRISANDTLLNNNKSKETIYILSENNYISNWIKKFGIEISPFHNIYTYFMDPYKPYIVYLFIETNQQLLLSLINQKNTYHQIFPINNSNQITPFTCNIEDEFDKTLIKIKLFEISSNNNLIYFLCFDYTKYPIQGDLFNQHMEFNVFFNAIFNLCYIDILEIISVVKEAEGVHYNKIADLLQLNEIYIHNQTIVKNLKEFFSSANDFINNSDIKKESFEDHKDNYENFSQTSSNVIDVDLNDYKVNNLNEKCIEKDEYNGKEIHLPNFKFNNCKANISTNTKTNTRITNTNFINNDSADLTMTDVDQHDLKSNDLNIEEAATITTNETMKNEIDFMFDVKKLLLYLQSWPIQYSFFFKTSLEERINYIYRLSEKINKATIRYKIKTKNFKKFTLIYIKNIHDKFNRLTLFLIYTKLSRISILNNPKWRLCNLFVLSWIYTNYKPQTDIEKNDMLELVYLITRYENHISNAPFGKFKIATSNVTTVEQMRQNFINRILIIYFNNNRIFSYRIIPAFQFKILWIFLVYIVELKIKLFEF